MSTHNTFIQYNAKFVVKEKKEIKGIQKKNREVKLSIGR